MAKVLSTKKLSPSLIEQARQYGLDIIEQEFIAIKPIWSEEKFNEIYKLFIKPYAIFTSANAVEIVDKYLHPHDTYYVVDWKIFCISGRTKEAVINASMLEKNIMATADYGKDLAQKIVEQGIKEVVFFCGNKRRDELPTILKQHHITVHEVVIYETVEVPSILTNDIDAVLFFSPSAVNSFFSVNQLEKKTVCFAIGTTTADSIAGYTDNKVIISEAPSQEKMLQSVQLYFEKKVGYE